MPRMDFCLRPAPWGVLSGNEQGPWLRVPISYGDGPGPLACTVSHDWKNDGTFQEKVG